MTVMVMKMMMGDTDLCRGVDEEEDDDDDDDEDDDDGDFSPMVSTSGPSRSRRWATRSCRAACSPCGPPDTTRRRLKRGRGSSILKQVSQSISSLL